MADIFDEIKQEEDQFWNDIAASERKAPKLIDPSTVKLSPSELAKMEPGYRPMGIFGPLEPQEILEIPKLAQIPGAVLEPVANAAEDLMSDFYRRTGFDPSSQPGVSPITMESYPITAGGPAGWALRQIAPKTAADIDKGAADIIKGFTTPGQQLMLPAAGVSKPLGKLFGASMIGDVPEAVKQIAEEGAVGIPRLAVDIGGGAGFIHGIPERAAAPIPQRAVVPPPPPRISKQITPESVRFRMEGTEDLSTRPLRSPKPTVPETVAPPIVEEVAPIAPKEIVTWDDAVAALRERGNGTETKTQIQALFPELQLSREAATGLARDAFGDNWKPEGKPLPPKGAEAPPVAPVEVPPEPAKPPLIEKGVAEPSPIPPAAPTSEVTAKEAAPTVPEPAVISKPTPVSEKVQEGSAEVPKLGYGTPLKGDGTGRYENLRTQVNAGDYVFGEWYNKEHQFNQQEFGRVVKVLKGALDIERPDGTIVRIREHLAKYIKGEVDTAKRVFELNKPKPSTEPTPPPAPVKEAATQNKVQSAATRFRPKEQVVFDKPLVGPSGAKLVAYEWRWQPEEFVDKYGEEKTRRVSNWEEAESSGDTGRDIVHQFLVEMPNGDKRLVSAESVPVLLGFTEKGKASRLPPLVSATKTLAQLRMKLATVKAQLDEYNAAVESANKLSLPEITSQPAIAQVGKDKGKRWATEWKMGDATVLQHDELPISAERKDALIGFWRANRVAETGAKQPYASVRDLQNRIERQQRKIKDITGTATTVTPAPPPSPIPEGPGAEPVGMGGAVGSEFQAQQPMRTATKNAAVDRDRADRGLPPMMDALRKSDPELWSQAMNIINEDWQAADKLIARFRDRPFIPTDVETMILLHRRVDLKNEFAKAQREFNSANTEGRPEAAATARVVRDEMSSKLGELDAMMGRGDQSAGTMAGRAFRARQLVMNEDYSLEQLVRDREGNLGRKLTDSEMSELEKQAKAWEEKSIALEKRVGELQKERDTLDSKLIAKQAELDAAKPTASSYVIGLAEKIVKDWDTRADAARARIKERMGRMSAGVDPTILLDLSEIGLSHLGHVGLDFAKWSEKMIGDVGEWAKPHLERVWERSQKLADRDIAKRAPKQAAKVKDAIVKPEPDIAQKIGENVTRKIAKNPNADLAWPARQLARHFWKSGVREPQALVDAVHEVLVKAKPELTRRQTMDILSGYGAYKLLSKEAIKVALRDIFGQLQQIGKLEDMAAGKAPSKSGFERRTPSDIERRLIKQVEEKKKEGGYNVTDPETQLRTAMQAAQRRLENQIKDLEHEISTRTKIVKKRTKLEYDAKTKALQERRDALKEIHDEIFKPALMTEAERLALWKKRTLEKIEDYKDRIASGDVMPRKRPEPPRLDPEAIKIRYELHKVHNAIMDIRLQDELSKRTTAKKAIDAVANVIRFSRAVMTGGEFSGVLRQGGFIGFGRPILAAKNLWPMFKALMSEEAQFKINEEIQTRPNAPLYSRFKLDLTESGVRLSSMEEHYMFTVSKRLEKIWGVKHSVRFLAAFQRAYTTFLNRLRADTFDAMADVYGTDKVTGEQIANFINVATGRGSTGIGKLAGPGANAVFFAPRYSISRFQLLMGQPMWHGNAKTRAMILKQYGRALAGASVVYSLGMMAGGTVETDPRHPDFGKIKIGNTRIDPLAGLAQVTRLMATEASGKRVTGKGKEIPIRGKVPYGNPSGWDVAATFARQKLSPAVGAAASFAAGKDPVGKPFKMTDAMIQTLTPITYGDVLAAMEEQGVPRGTAIGVLAIFGMGVQTYDTNQKRER